MEILTKKNLFIKIYNEILERICRTELDIEYFKQKAQTFKIGSPERRDNMKRVEENRKGLFYDQMLILIIEKRIKK